MDKGRNIGKPDGATVTQAGLLYMPYPLSPTDGAADSFSDSSVHAAMWWFFASSLAAVRYEMLYSGVYYHRSYWNDVGDTRY